MGTVVGGSEYTARPDRRIQAGARPARRARLGALVLAAADPMTTLAQPSRLAAWLDQWGAIPPLLVAEFVVWLGFGGLLPVLPLYFTEQGVDLSRRSASSSRPGRPRGSSASRSSAGSPTAPAACR